MYGISLLMAMNTQLVMMTSMTNRLKNVHSTNVKDRDHHESYSRFITYSIWVPYTPFTRSSKHQANVFKICVHDVCFCCLLFAWRLFDDCLMFAWCLLHRVNGVESTTNIRRKNAFSLFFQRKKRRTQEQKWDNFCSHALTVGNVSSKPTTICWSLARHAIISLRW